MKLLVISPYLALADLFQEAKEKTEEKDLIINIEIGDLEVGLEIAQRYIANHEADIILSRGGTAALLRQAINIPVIEVPISVYDILRAINTAKLTNDEFAIAGYNNITRNAKIILEVMNYKVPVLTFKDKQSAVKEILKLKQKGIKLLLTDNIGSEISKANQLNSILISSGRESVEESLLSAKDFYIAHRKTLEKNLMYEKIFSLEYENSMLVTANKEVLFSSFSDYYLSNVAKNLIDDDELSFAKDTGGAFEFQDNENFISVNFKPILKGSQKHYYIHFNRTNDPLLSMNVIRKNNASSSNLAQTSELATLMFQDDTIKQINKFSKTSYPILISGYTGTGKEYVAQLIFHHSQFGSREFIVFDCENTDESIQSLLKHSNKTILFKNIDTLENTSFEKHLTLIKKENLHINNRLIFVTNSDITFYIRSQLQKDFPILYIHLPSLYQRKEEIPTIAALVLSTLNTNYSRQVIGFEQDSLELLKSFDWESNLSQFLRIVREAYFYADGSYIAKNDLQFILDKEQTTDLVQSTNTIILNSSKSLDEMNEDIIRTILEEENGNRENTANRLGISRSTLWRRLKEMNL